MPGDIGIRQVQLREEDGQLATLIGEVEAGESVTILRGERPVAQIIPFPEANATVPPQRAAAIRRMKAIMDQGYDLGGFKIEDRDGLYERDAAIERREAAIRRLDEIMDEGIPLGGSPPTRDEMHDGR